MDAPEDDLLRQAVEAFNAGEAAEALALFHALVARDPTHALAHHQLGILALSVGDFPTAIERLQYAAALAPLDPDFHNNLGVALNAAGDPASACDAFRMAVALNRDFGEAVNNLGAALEATGEVLDAIAAYRRALEIDPGYVQARDNLDMACVKTAPAWHFPMVADAPRNAAYDQALRRAAPGRRVLDIGSGSGLLAMMAARAGAVSVDTCETVGPIAETARRIIAANGLDDRIAVHAKHSERIRVGVEMAAPAEVLVTETFASGLLSEAVLPTLEHARRHLLTPDAQVIPRAAAAWGYLAGGDVIEGHLFASGASGFDLSGFDVFATGKVGLHLDRLPHDVLSEDFEIFAFDLTQAAFAAERRRLTVRATRSGRCVGVAQWLKLDMDGLTTYENRPDVQAGANGWMHVVYRFAEPLWLDAGDAVTLLASHSRTAMTVALDPER